MWEGKEWAGGHSPLADPNGSVGKLDFVDTPIQKEDLDISLPPLSILCSLLPCNSVILSDIISPSSALPPPSNTVLGVQSGPSPSQCFISLSMSCISVVFLRSLFVFLSFFLIPIRILSIDLILIALFTRVTAPHTKTVP